MNRTQLEHILRACSAITMEKEFVVVGSQAILGQHPDAPPEVTVSIEADVYARYHAEVSTLIDGAIGEGSRFHETFGYYAHGVGPETALLPSGWEQRLVPIANENTQGATGWCLDPTDLAISKLVAGRPHDFAFVTALIAHGLIDRDELRSRIDATPLEPSDFARLKNIVNGMTG